MGFEAAVSPCRYMILVSFSTSANLEHLFLDRADVKSYGWMTWTRSWRARIQDNYHRPILTPKLGLFPNLDDFHADGNA